MADQDPRAPVAGQTCERDPAPGGAPSGGSVSQVAQPAAEFADGGADGIGAECVRQFHAQGARVAILDINVEKGETLARELGDGVHFEACDLALPTEVASAVEWARLALRRPVSVLVNNAARDDRHRDFDPLTMTADEWDATVAVNLRHMPLCINAFADDLRRARRGSVVNMGSTSWMKGQAELMAYATCKAAVLGLTKTYARALGRWGVRVNAVSPGWIFTERQERLWANPENTAAHLSAQCIHEKMMPADVARMVLWLASDDSRLITGQHFIADAGSV